MTLICWGLWEMLDQMEDTAPEFVHGYYKDWTFSIDVFPTGHSIPTEAAIRSINVLFAEDSFARRVRLSI